MNPTYPLPPIEDLLPHRGMMLLLDRVIDFAGASAATECVPRSDAWYADGQGNMPAWIGIELMAQTVATHVGLQKRAEGLPPRHGALLGTRSYRSAVPSFQAGEMLHICATLLFRDTGGFSAYDCNIARGGQEIATATIKVFEAEDFQSFLQGNST
jgi:predicted hotdog family 3-hydroxylacyl-ACP dehydratase